MSSTSSALRGRSYGSSTPVIPVSSPRRALAYRPLTSRARPPPSEVETNTSANGTPAACVVGADGLPGLGVRGDHRDQDDHAVGGEQPGDPADPA